MTNLTKRLGDIKERLELALKDGSFALRVNTWLTAVDGRQFCAHAPTDLALLLRIVEIQAEALDRILGEFEDMQNSNDIRQDWHKRAREAQARVQELLEGEK